MPPFSPLTGRDDPDPMCQDELNQRAQYVIGVTIALAVTITFAVIGIWLLVRRFTRLRLKYNSLKRAYEQAAARTNSLESYVHKLRTRIDAATQELDSLRPYAPAGRALFKLGEYASVFEDIADASGPQSFPPRSRAPGTYANAPWSTAPDHNPFVVGADSDDDENNGATVHGPPAPPVASYGDVRAQPVEQTPSRPRRFSAATSPRALILTPSTTASGTPSRSSSRRKSHTSPSRRKPSPPEVDTHLSRFLTSQPRQVPKRRPRPSQDDRAVELQDLRSPPGRAELANAPKVPSPLRQSRPCGSEVSSLSSEDEPERDKVSPVSPELTAEQAFSSFSGLHAPPLPPLQGHETREVGPGGLDGVDETGRDGGADNTRPVQGVVGPAAEPGSSQETGVAR